MPYEVLNSARLAERSGLTASVPYAERLEEALNNQKSERGMELVAIDAVRPEEPLYIFRHETD